ncbi:MAG: GTP-binding protein [Balneolaceae bacterium]|nr:GTP-binding protein [Balneolaceae bacterium]
MSRINPSYRKTGFEGAKTPSDPIHLAKQIIDGNKAALSRAITLAESRKKEHQALANQVLEHCVANHGVANHGVANQSEQQTLLTLSRRIGITGYPGAGKSTLLEALGLQLVAQGASVAVLTVDPTGLRTDGSILGDKTRMNELSKHPSAYIRPSPSSKSLGGVTTSTYTSIQLCEAAGFDWVFVETVGVGQSEAMVSMMTDIVCLVLIPGAGDDLQGMKRGLMDTVDALIINKSDGPQIDQAKQTAQHYQQALGWELLMDSEGEPETSVIHKVSAETGEGVEELLSWLHNRWDIGLSAESVHRKRSATLDRLMTIEASHIVKQWMESVLEPTSPEWQQAKEHLLKGDQTLASAVDPIVQKMLKGSE